MAVALLEGHVMEHCVSTAFLTGAVHAANLSWFPRTEQPHSEVPGLPCQACTISKVSSRNRQPFVGQAQSREDGDSRKGLVESFRTESQDTLECGESPSWACLGAPNHTGP